MPDTPPCPQCQCEYTYEMGALIVCPECAHEWNPAEAAADSDAADNSDVIRDAVGNILADGDSVVIVKDLPVKGRSQAHQGGHKGQQHPTRPRQRRSQYRRQGRRLRSHDAQIERHQEGLTN